MAKQRSRSKPWQVWVTLLGWAGFICLALSSCRAPADPSPATPAPTGFDGQPASEHSLKLGQTVGVNGERLMLTFVEVERDNRCPRGVQCIVGGEAVVVFEARNGASESRLTFAFGAQAETVCEFAGYRIEVVAVDPYPVAGEEIASEDYVVRCAVESV